MRRTLHALGITIAILALTQQAVPAQSVKDADAFIRQTYKRYDTKSLKEPQFLGREASSVFSPSLVQLIRRDEKNTPSGYVGKLDWDPICSCQDFDGDPLRDLQITKDSASRATASVTLFFFSDSSVKHLRLHLIWLPQGWRIDDIETKDIPSLRKLLQRSRVRGMNSSARATSVRFDADSLWVDLADGRVIGVPLAWFPRLLCATPEERNHARVSTRDLHWESLDEDISIAVSSLVLPIRLAATRPSRPDPPTIQSLSRCNELRVTASTHI
jgi:hypothetical protein